NSGRNLSGKIERTRFCDPTARDAETMTDGSAARIRPSDITVSALEHADIVHILDYWYGASPEYLHALGVVPEKLPKRSTMAEMLARKVEHESARPTILTIKLRGASIGVHELTHIEPGVSAVMHAHIWRAQDRGRGIGVISYVRAMERFFAAHGFQRIVCETPTANSAANRIKQSLGIVPSGRGTIYLPIMSKPVETTRYEVERAALPAIAARAEHQWTVAPGGVACGINDAAAARMRP